MAGYGVAPIGPTSNTIQYPIGPSGNTGINNPIQTSSAPAAVHLSNGPGGYGQPINQQSGAGSGMGYSSTPGAILPSNGPSVGPSKDFSYGSPGLFSGAAAQQGNDYDTIMAGYKSLLNGPGIAPNLQQYTESSDLAQSIKNLGLLSQTGGYSSQDLQDLRARAVAPVRSIYANAQANLDRSRALSGGYSPNYAAATAKMAREQSDLEGNALTNANAGIAQNVASNKLSIAPSYAAAAGTENTARTAVEGHNTDIMNMVNQFNTSLKTQALEGMKGIYGTTPALAQLFGSQVAQNRSLDQNQQQINMQSQQGIMRLLQSILGRG